MSTKKIESRLRRKKRVRGKVVGSSERPRFSVFRSGKHIYAQIVNDVKRSTLVSASDLELAKSSDEKKAKNEKGSMTGNTKIIRAGLVGQFLAKKALKKKIKKVIFDRNGYKYHGRIKSLAEGAREGGLIF